jgi:hypothetical protein
MSSLSGRVEWGSGLVVGTVGYRPDPVDAPAGGHVLICSSQPDGDIVIDL